MIAIGQYHELEIARITRVGAFLTDGTNEVLLPTKYLPKGIEPGQTLRVFVYLDHEERPIATTLEPYILPGQFRLLRVNHVNRFGAFLDWGLEKDLFVPFKEQARPMEKGKRFLVHLYLDDRNGRLVASSRTNQFLNNTQLTLQKGDEVDLIISHFSELGVNVIINGKHKGLLFKGDIYDDLRLGEQARGFVRNIRTDGKIDVSLQREGVANIEPSAARILEELQNGKGFLRLNDDSDPEDIKILLQMSKKSFKKAIGSLYKDRLIDIRPDGIHLLQR